VTFEQFPVIEISGTAFERGRQHGTRARARIERSIAHYAILFGFCGIGWAEAQRLGAAYRGVIGEFDAELLQEMEGVAAGAGRAADEILALNARTEILPPTFPGKPTGEWLASRLGRAADPGECTAIAVSPARSATGGALLAQNWDWLGTQREALVLLRIREPDGRSCLTLTEAGMLAKIGLNDRGFGVCLNILRSEDDGAHAGVPVHVLLRALLRRASVKDAIEFSSRIRAGASSNILCADASGDAAALELAPSGVHVVRDPGGTLCHTNHFLAPAALRAEVAPPPSLSSQPRLECARRHAAGHSKLGIAELQALLRDESDGFLSVCRRPDPSLPEQARIESVASVIMELARGVMHVAPGIPSQTDYRSVALAAEPALSA
jgi:isopenicillin-N N-acyltransferase-like protein